MASYYASRERKNLNPWKARVQREGIEYYLGYFHSKAEAEEKERDFASRFPSMRGRYERIS